MNMLTLFAKHWTPGKVKTRLAATVGDESAAGIYREFVATLLERLSTLGDRRAVYFSPEKHREEFANLAGESWQLRLQSDGGLGDRMARMFEAELAAPDARCVLLGTDSPNVPIPVVESAFDALHSVKLVLGPTGDGGYYLVGARDEVPPLFEEMPFSTPQLWQATIDRLRRLGWREGEDYALLPAWYDVDTVEDLHHLQRDLHALTATNDPALARLAKQLVTNSTP